VKAFRFAFRTPTKMEGKRHESGVSVERPWLVPENSYRDNFLPREWLASNFCAFPFTKSNVKKSTHNFFCIVSGRKKDQKQL
jgi:hypothetical protein